jgi:Cu(I)-responsive transcriptional regulator
MLIGTVARESGIPAKTIRYYEGIGLIDSAERAASGYRIYGEADVETLRFIHRARSLGFSVNDVASLIALWRDKRRASAQVRNLASEHVKRIDQKVTELQTMRDTMVDLIDRCHGDSRPDCPILKDLAGEDAAGAEPQTA